MDVLGVLAIALAMLAVVAVVVRYRAGHAKRHFETQLQAQEQAERQLRSAHARLKAILDTALDAVVVMDHKGEIAEFNRSAERMFGHRASDVIGRSLADVLVPEPQREMHRSGLARYLATGEARVLGTQLEMMGLRADGSLVPLELRVNRLPGEGMPVFVAFLSDLTEKRRAERTSLESQQLLRAVIDNSMAVIYVKDLSGRYLLANRRFDQVIQLAPGAAIGKTDYDFFSREDANAFRAMDERVASASQTLIEEEAVPQEDGVHTYVSAKSPLRDPSGTTYAIFGISTDITDRKRAEEQLLKQNKTLELLNGVSSALLAELDRENIAQIITDAGRAVSGAAFGAFFYSVRDERGESYMLYALSGAPREAFSRFPLPRDTALFAPTFRGEGVVRIADVLTDPRYGRSAPHFGMPEGHLPVRSYLAVPVVSGSGEVLGGLFYGHPTPGVFGAEAEMTLVGLAAQAALSIGNANLHTALQREVQRYKQADLALRESEERFRTLAESLPHLVWTCRADGWCDYLSRQWIEYTGRPEAEQLGSGWAEHLHPEDRARAEAAWTHATQTGHPYDVEFRIRRADGVYRWFKTRAVPLRDGDGRIVKWFGSNTDFEEYKSTERKLQVQVERLALLDCITRAISERQDLRSIFQVVLHTLEESLPIDFGCVCLYGAHTLTVACVGARSGELAERLALAEGVRVEIDENGLGRCVRGQLVYERNLSELPFPFPRRLAAAGLGCMVAAPIALESKVFGLLIVARLPPHDFDSTDCEFLRQLSEHIALAAHQVQMYEALLRAYDDLHHSQQSAIQQERLRALGQMASGVAHDINNALSPVSIYTELILEREKQLSPSTREQLEIIQRAVSDAAQTIARMSEFYRQREPELLLKPVQINELVTQVLDLTRARWSDMPQQRGIVVQVRCELAADVPAIAGVESELREALVNLVFNAVDAMPEGGTLTLRTKATEPGTGSTLARRVHLTVQDSGVGMDELTRRRCLEPFFTTKGERGTGLGLAMVLGVARRHEAEIEIESEPGRGTLFDLSFPVADPAEAEQSPQRTGSVPLLRVLVVDDDKLILESLRVMLEGDGHTVLSANGGQEGIDAFVTAEATEPVDLVITDLGMPRVDGRRVAAAVKSARPSLPVILITGWGRTLVADELPAHVDRVLSKPPKLLELRAALAELSQIRSRR